MHTATAGQSSARGYVDLRVSDGPGVVVRVYTSISDRAVGFRCRSCRIEGNPDLFDRDTALRVGILYHRRDLRSGIVGQSACTRARYG